MIRQKWAVERLLEWTVEEMTKTSCQCGWIGEKETVTPMRRPLEQDPKDDPQTKDPLTRTMNLLNNVEILPLDSQCCDSVSSAKPEDDAKLNLMKRALASTTAIKDVAGIFEDFQSDAAILGDGQLATMFLEVFLRLVPSSKIYPFIQPTDGTVAHRPVERDPSRIIVHNNDRRHAAMNGGKGVRKLIEKVYTKQAGSWDDP